MIKSIIISIKSKAYSGPLARIKLQRSVGVNSVISISVTESFLVILTGISSFIVSDWLIVAYVFPISKWIGQAIHNNRHMPRPSLSISVMLVRQVNHLLTYLSIYYWMPNEVGTEKRFVRAPVVIASPNSY